MIKKCKNCEPKKKEVPIINQTKPQVNLEININRGGSQENHPQQSLFNSAPNQMMFPIFMPNYQMSPQMSPQTSPRGQYNQMNQPMNNFLSPQTSPRQQNQFTQMSQPSSPMKNFFIPPSSPRSQPVTPSTVSPSTTPPSTYTPSMKFSPTMGRHRNSLQIQKSPNSGNVPQISFSPKKPSIMSFQNSPQRTQIPEKRDSLTYDLGRLCLSTEETEDDFFTTEEEGDLEPPPSYYKSTANNFDFDINRYSSTFGIRKNVNVKGENFFLAFYLYYYF